MIIKIMDLLTPSQAERLAAHRGTRRALTGFEGGGRGREPRDVGGSGSWEQLSVDSVRTGT